ncbi:MAG: polymer-forming cytoskeletal protein [Spirochaetales bacterium]|nr:polymer-forming cytoskeletal protein [Spirochaetales bacterium]
MAKNNDLIMKEKIKTTLGNQTNFQGTMRFRDSLKIDGSFQGEIISKGFLYIESGAVVKANIKVGSIVIGGIVKGNIEASERLEMLSTGQVFGNIRTAKLKIADGVVFDGKCEMIRNPDKINIFSHSVEEIKQSTQSI